MFIYYFPDNVKSATGKRYSLLSRKSEITVQEILNKKVENILLKICLIKIYPVIFASLKLIIKETYKHETH